MFFFIYPAQQTRKPALRPDNFRHGVVEGKTDDLNEKVDGVAGFIALGPAPIGVFDEEAVVVEHFEVLSGPLNEPQATFLKQRGQGDDAGGADLLPCPGPGGQPPSFWRRVPWGAVLVAAVVIKAVGGHSLSSNGVG